MARVSVVIPSYNHQRFIVKCIESVLTQTFQDFEIIIIDDCSSDGSVDQIKSFKDERIKFEINSSNNGATSTVNRGISLARGEFIAILSSDDLWHKDKLERQIGFMDGNPDVGAVFSLAELIDENGLSLLNSSDQYANIFHQSNRGRHAWLNHFFFNYNCLCHPSALIRRSCFEKVGLYTEGFAQLPDFEMWIKICTNFEIYIIEERLVYFRRLDKNGNASSTTPENLQRLENELSRILLRFADLDFNEFLRVFPDYIRGSANQVSTKFHLSRLCIQIEKFQQFDHIYRYMAYRLIREWMTETTSNPHQIDISLDSLLDRSSRYHYIKGVQSSVWEYVLARLGIECGGLAAVDGMQVLYDLMKNDEMRTSIGKKHDFHPIDLIRISSTVALFPHAKEKSYQLEIGCLKNDLKMVMNSPSFRLGKLLLWPLRTIRSIVRSSR
jgi:glycosyltransferase involved in cell wall biosynthesis